MCGDFYVAIHDVLRGKNVNFESVSTRFRDETKHDFASESIETPSNDPFRAISVGFDSKFDVDDVTKLRFWSLIFVVSDDKK